VKGGEYTLAISEKRKHELVAEYSTWLGDSKAVILAGYIGLTMKDLDALRDKIREVGGEFHVVKNTLGKLAFEESGMPLPEGFFEGSTAAGFAFKDAPSLAKAMTEFARTNDFLKIKGGYLSTRPMTAEQVKALADLPPLPVMRARLLGALLAPASQLARTLAEPGRRIAAVVKARSEQEAAPASA
jgi:large subunit ribosomal protein L10